MMPEPRTTFYKATFAIDIDASVLSDVAEALAPFGVTLQVRLVPVAARERELTPVARVAPRADGRAASREAISTNPCPECGKYFVPDAMGNRYCTECLDIISAQGRRLDASLKSDMKKERKVRAANRDVPVVCQVCGKTFAAKSTNAMRCPECKALE